MFMDFEREEFFLLLTFVFPFSSLRVHISYILWLKDIYLVLRVWSSWLLPESLSRNYWLDSRNQSRCHLNYIGGRTMNYCLLLELELVSICLIGSSEWYLSLYANAHTVSAFHKGVAAHQRYDRVYQPASTNLRRFLRQFWIYNKTAELWNV
jgi:hypothetical protein